VSIRPAEFADVGVSGVSESRPKLDELLAACRFSNQCAGDRRSQRDRRGGDHDAVERRHERFIDCAPGGDSR
jgi:hypothetical protein